jgi:hypothetical protein
VRAFPRSIEPPLLPFVAASRHPCYNQNHRGDAPVVVPPRSRRSTASLTPSPPPGNTPTAAKNATTSRPTPAAVVTGPAAASHPAVDTMAGEGAPLWCRTSRHRLVAAAPPRCRAWAEPRLHDAAPTTGGERPSSTPPPLPKAAAHQRPPPSGPAPPPPPQRGSGVGRPGPGHGRPAPPPSRRCRPLVPYDRTTQISPGGGRIWP